MEYKIITETDFDRLEQSVNEAITNGWTPQGGICVARTARGCEFAQAMTKTA